jgi:curved DNA-binding protein CbpA
MNSSEQPDLYAILGVDPDASSEQISHAYRTLLRRHHPDTRPNTPSNPAQQPATEPERGHQARLQQVLAAYAVLHDPDRRADYDRHRQPNPAQPAPQSRPISADSVVIIGTVTHHRHSTPAWIATIDHATTTPPIHPLWEWIRAAWDR